LNTDLSVAPEIAQLAAPLMPVQQDSALPRTDGRAAGDLADLAGAPQRWWDLVRFDPEAPVRIPVPDAPGAWLLVLPPGSTVDCDCRQATALAGEALETPSVPGMPSAPETTVHESGLLGLGTDSAARPLRPGRVRVHGVHGWHRLRTAGHGYSVTVHWK
jgi:hypothetical protein